MAATNFTNISKGSTVLWFVDAFSIFIWWGYFAKWSQVNADKMMQTRIDDLGNKYGRSCKVARPTSAHLLCERRTGMSYALRTLTSSLMSPSDRFWAVTFFLSFLWGFRGRLGSAKWKRLRPKILMVPHKIFSQQTRWWCHVHLHQGCPKSGPSAILFLRRKQTTCN